LKAKKHATYFDTDQIKENIKLQTIKGGMITTATQGILFVIRLASIVVLARILIPEHFGLMGMVTALLVLIERFQDIGLGEAIIQKKDITHEQVSNLFWITLCICISFSIIVALSAKIIAWFYKEPRLVWITVSLSFNFILSGLVIQHKAIIRRQMRFDHFSIISIFSTVFGLSVGILLALRGFGYWALVWKALATSFLTTVLSWSLCRWRPGLPVRNAGIKPLLLFGGNVTGTNILFYLSRNLDSILLGRFFGPLQVGLYTKAAQLTAIPVTQLLEPTKNVGLPVLSTLQNDSVTYSNYFNKILAVLCFVYMPIIVYIAIYAHPIVTIALGSQWMQAVPIFRLLAISFFASPIVSMYGMILLSSGQGKRYLFWGLFTNLSTIVFIFIGIKWGALGIAASWSISTLANIVFSIIFVFKNSPVSRVSTLNKIYRPAIASIIMGVGLYLSYEFISSFNLVIQMALSISLGCILYFTTWLLFPGGYKNIIDFISYPLMILKRK